MLPGLLLQRLLFDFPGRWPLSLSLDFLRSFLNKVWLDFQGLLAQSFQLFFLGCFLWKHLASRLVAAEVLVRLPYLLSQTLLLGYLALLGKLLHGCCRSCGLAFRWIAVEVMVCPCQLVAAQL